MYEFEAQSNSHNAGFLLENVEHEKMALLQIASSHLLNLIYYQKN